MHCLPAVLLVSAVSVVGWHTVAARPVKCAGRFKNGDCGPDQYCGIESQRCEECSYICDRVHFPDGSCTSKCPHYGKTSSPPPTTPTTPTIPVITTANPTKAPMEKDVTANTPTSTEYSKAQTLGLIIGGVLLAILAVGGLGIFACIRYDIPKLIRGLHTPPSQGSAFSPAIVDEAAALMSQTPSREAVDLSSRSGEVNATSESSELSGSINQPSTSTHPFPTCQDPMQNVRPTSATHTASTSADFTDPSRNAVITLAQGHSDGQGPHTNGEEMEMEEIDRDTTLAKERYESDDASPPSSNPPSHLLKRIKEAGQSDCNVQMATPPNPVATVSATTKGQPTFQSVTNSHAIASTSTSAPSSAPVISRKDSGVSTTSETLGVTVRKDSEASTSSSTTRTPAYKDSGVSTASETPGATNRKDSKASTSLSTTGMLLHRVSGVLTASSSPGATAHVDSGASADSSATGTPDRKDSATSTTSPDLQDPEPKPDIPFPVKETRCPIRVSDTNSQANRQVPPIRVSSDVP